ncbi:PREDICTED: cytochrome P450 18a1 isoform X1 [Ceratosolen solmsi marchali]|uniref:Cytochrome P450 18a1 isoform X1 n=1 Tax=Ceratosolen solmsi marchali TaxID=326594 RepID=A0AAJ7DWV8_9HYME|nr:PREDICTED: cytochrome P450 18a1 isoform X1 [Ceratosolen solmsi marchali]
MFVEHCIQLLYTAIGSTSTDAFHTLLVFFGVLAIVRLVQWYRQLLSLPPGPWGLPLFGYLPFMKGVDLHLRFGELAKKYGSMFSARLGTQLVIVLSDYRIIRETFRREEFTGRPHTEFINILGGYGIINSEGALWKDQRRFIHDKLRNFGMTYRGTGKKVMETTIMKEVDLFIRSLEIKEGAPTNVSFSLGMSITNVICSIIMSVRFKYGDSRFKRFMNLIDEGFQLFGRLSFVNYIPMFRYLPWLQSVKTKLTANREEMADFFQETVDQHKATFDKSNIRDLVDAYLLEIEKAKAEGREDKLFQGKNHDRQLQQILGDLFSAGMETVKTTLEWAVILMLHYPEAAKAVQEELDQVVGRSRMPSLEDLQFLPVTEATILEVLRRTSIVPLGTTHATTREVNLNGFRIPSGSQVIPLLHAVHMDQDLWEEPAKFQPNRFLTAEGKVYKPEYFMPFGVGRRMCLGDVLARMELFLFFATLLHTFDLRLPEGACLPSLKGNAGVTVTPDPFKVCLLRRDRDVPLRCVGSK